MDNPKQYIQGWTEFFKLKFKVTTDVLIPRPETELLVAHVLKFIENNPTYDIPYTIYDIGTGSGNIAISIAKNLPNVQVVAIDISTKALKVAKQNATFHGVEDKITFIQADLLTVIPSETRNPKIKKSTDLSLITRDDNLMIVTNLPYIPSERIPYLDSSVKDFEPHIALDGGGDGFELYRKLFEQIKEKGWKPELFIGEIDHTHGDIAQKEARKFFPKAQVEVKTDLAHKPRILTITHQVTVPKSLLP